MATKDPENRKSYFLNVTPVNYSLTEGTNIPPPASSPGRSPSLVEPPTPGGGPLSSHPTTPPAEREEPAPSTANTMTRERTDSFRTPTSPASAAQMSPTAQKPKGVRRLLSLTNLRSSFSSSRTSLSLPRQSNDTNPYHTAQSAKRPASPGAASSFAPSTFTTTTSTTATGTRPPLREKKSGNWFKRKSSLFLLNGNGELYTVGEEGRPDTRESKRLKESPAPLLPEIGQLKGGRISGGNLGWDEGAFKRDVAT